METLCLPFPLPVFQPLFGDAVREAFAAIFAIRIRAELQYKEQLGETTPLYIANTAKEVNDSPDIVYLSGLEQYWVWMVEWVVLRPLFRFIPMVFDHNES